MNSNNHGGARPGAGRKAKVYSPFRIIEDHEEAMKKAKEKIPPDWMKSDQADGAPDLHSEEIQNQVDAFLIERGLRQYVPDKLIESYALTLARYIQAEEMISRRGLVADLPRGGVGVSPYVSISMEYNKRSLAIWSQIYQTIRDASSAEGDPVALESPKNSLLDLLEQNRKQDKISSTS